MKKVRLEAETGPNPRDGPRRRKRRRAGPRLLSRRGCRRRGSLSHARNVPTFATSPNGAPGRFPVTPREATFSPRFPAATSRHRVSLRVPGTAWPASCLNVRHVGEFRDICPIHPRARAAGRRGTRHLVETGIAWRAPRPDPCEFSARFRAGTLSAIGAASFVTNMSMSSPGSLPDCKVRRFRVIQMPTYRVEKPDETREPNLCLSGSRGCAFGKEPPRRTEMPMNLSGCFLQERRFRRRTKGMAVNPAANRGFAAAQGCYRERTKCGR